MPFDRNSAGQRILEEKVVRGTLAKGRQMAFVARLLESRNGTEEHSNLIRMEMEVREFQDGIIRITKGMLRCLHPQFDYKKSTFLVVAIHPEPVDEQLKLMAALKQGAFLERGQKVFQCWRHIEESRGGGAWMLVFFECFGFFVFHTNGPELVTVEG